MIEKEFKSIIQARCAITYIQVQGVCVEQTYDAILVRQKKPGTHTPYVSPNPRLGVDESWG